MRHIPLTGQEVDTLLDFAEKNKDTQRKPGYSDPLNGTQARLEEACTNEEDRTQLARKYVNWARSGFTADERESVKKSIR